jgi:MFS family permease
MFDFRGKVLVGLITLTCSVGFMLFGYDQGVLSGLIGADNQFGADFNHPNPTTQGLIVSVYQLGNVGGSIVIFLFGDALGRKKSILLSSIVMLIGAILQTASVNRGMMYAARVITGFVSSTFKISKENDIDTYRETEEILPPFRCGRRRPALPKIVGSSSPSTHLLSFSEFSLHTGRLSKPISELQVNNTFQDGLRLCSSLWAGAVALPRRLPDGFHGDFDIIDPHPS